MEALSPVPACHSCSLKLVLLLVPLLLAVPAGLLRPCDPDAVAPL